MSYTSTNTITITNGANNTIWYTGNVNNDVFSNTTSINSFTNSGIILGGGGSRGNNDVGFNGKNGLINSNTGTITTLTNNGAFLGGGGCNGGAGGGGGNQFGGGGGSLSTSINAGPGCGGGPGGSGMGANVNNYSAIPGFGPFGGGGLIDHNGPVSSEGTIDGGGPGGPNSGGGYGGGTGGGGGGGGGGGAGNGNGGYSISNNGIIRNFNNLQGGLISNTDLSNNYPYGPLFYCGKAPINYNIQINSTTRYGQLWCTGVTNTDGSMNVDIAVNSTITLGTYLSVLKFNASTTATLNNTSGNYGLYAWKLVPRGLYYDLVVTNRPYPTVVINQVNINNTISDGKYHHIAITVSGNIHTTYLDGSAVAVNTNAEKLLLNSAISNVYLGSAADLTNGYSGNIGQFKIYNRSLPDSDILSIYNSDSKLYENSY